MSVGAKQFLGCLDYNIEGGSRSLHFFFKFLLTSCMMVWSSFLIPCNENGVA